MKTTLVRLIRPAVLVAILFALLCAGCGNYRVIDVRTGDVYYTRNIQYKPCGAIRFRDVVTYNRVTLSNTQIEKICPQELRCRTCTQPRCFQPL